VTDVIENQSNYSVAASDSANCLRWLALLAIAKQVHLQRMDLAERLSAVGDLPLTWLAR
jgi:hypothetical protein